MNEEFDDSNSDDPAGINELIRESKKEVTQHLGVETEAEKIAERVVAGTSVKKRKIKEIKLDSLTSISGGKPGGKGSGRANEGYSDIICFNCGQKGHRKAKCTQFPSSKRKNVFDDGGFNRNSKVGRFL